MQIPALRALVAVAVIHGTYQSGVVPVARPLLRQPSVSRTQIAFVYANNIWIVARAGGAARQLTQGTERKADPSFAPDGSAIAYTETVDGTPSVFVIATSGGAARRLTYHPAGDAVVGWTPDGSRVLFRSLRETFLGLSFVGQDEGLYTVPVAGGAAARIALPSGYDASYSPDGGRLAYLPHTPANALWSHYQGGRTTAIWIVRLDDASIVRVPRENSNDLRPMWIGGTVYFLSDRSGPATLFGYDTATKQVAPVLPPDSVDIATASAGPGAIAYEQLGSLYLYDLPTRRASLVNVTVGGELPEIRRHTIAAGPEIVAAELSPAGDRVAFQSHGDILVAGTAAGTDTAQNVTNTPGAMERDPTWSPDGQSLAYLTDASGEYVLRLQDRLGRRPVRDIPLGEAPSFYFTPQWSPDGRKISYYDVRMQLWWLDVASGTSVQVDRDEFEQPERGLNPVWSPDSRWIVYTKQLPNHLYALFLYSLDHRVATQLTDESADARYPAFDRSGAYLYFTAATNVATGIGWLNLSSDAVTESRSVYIVMLDPRAPSPLARGTRASGATRAGADSEADRRPIALPIEARDWNGLMSVRRGSIILLTTNPTGGHQTAYRWSFADRALTQIADGILGFDGGTPDERNTTFRLSGDGTRMLYLAAGHWTVAPTGGAPSGATRHLDLSGLRVAVDPRAEWREMYHEAWRRERDGFYDPGYHGLDIGAAAARYEPFLDGLATHDDWHYILAQAVRPLSVGHLFVFDPPPAEDARHGATVGLLGADYIVDHDRYRIARIYRNGGWDPTVAAPLGVRGTDVAAGDYVLAVAGKPLTAETDIYQLFVGTAGRSTVLTVGTDPSGAGARTVTVVPVSDETALRRLAWIGDNGRVVNRLSGGRIGYGYLPNTSGAGYTAFDRYVFSQDGKAGLVLDARYNGGGSIPDYMIDMLRREPYFVVRARHGSEMETPTGGSFAARTLLTNEYTMSGGDALSYMFREARLGPLVGKRTWGGLVGEFDAIPLLDGSIVSVPRAGLYGMHGKWAVENHGVAPDVDADIEPAAWRAGHDTQLERAVAVVTDSLAAHPVVAPVRPEYPNYYR
jgi:tricorn protease